MRADRKKRREAGDAEVTSDTEEEYEIRKFSEEEKVKYRARKAEEIEAKLIENAKKKFTYE